MKDLSEPVKRMLSKNMPLTISNEQNEGIKPEPTQLMIGEIIENISNPDCEILGQISSDGALRLRKSDILIEKEYEE